MPGNRKFQDFSKTVKTCMTTLSLEKSATSTKDSKESCNGPKSLETTITHLFQNHSADGSTTSNVQSVRGNVGKFSQ